MLVDAQGYLRNTDDWTESFVQVTAVELGLTLTEQHWQVLKISRTLVLKHQQILGLRRLVSALQAAGVTQASSLYLQRLFPGFTLRIIAKLAGLTKPAQCL
ncbi:MAG: TusE/DsrC/DsvC family sulfur relay protein [Bacteroidota bacterium]